MNNRKDLLAIFEAGLDAVKPDQALIRHLSLSGSKLTANGKEYDLEKGKVYVAGGGKGAAPMAKALETLLGARIGRGKVVVKYEHGLELEHIEIAEASHPVPDQAGEKAAGELLEIARQTGPDDLLICLLTGGASSLLPLPGEGLTLSDLQKTTEVLLASGATISELNTVRKHLSRISGGQLAAAAGGKTLSVIVSDVIGDDLGAIASGPTAPDQSTFSDCLAIIAKYNLAGRLPEAVLQRLQKGANGEIPETPKPGDRIFDSVNNVIVASNKQALEAAAKKAQSLGYQVKIVESPLMGEARDSSRRLIDKAKEIQKTLAKGAKPVCLLAGGETTVTLKGSGLGGRNQEMALAAAIELDQSQGIFALFAGTDGTDGPTDAAGGFADAESAARMGGLAKASAALARNDSYNILNQAGDLLKTGPTLTNVMDLAILLICPKP